MKKFRSKLACLLSLPILLIEEPIHETVRLWRLAMYRASLKSALKKWLRYWRGEI